MALAIYGSLIGALLGVALGQLQNITISHPKFSFDTYPTLLSLSVEQKQPLNFSTETKAVYFSHIYGSLRSTVKGRVKEIKYISATDSLIRFQIWNISDEGTLQIKGIISATPVGKGTVNVLTANTQIEIEVGDLFGVWVEGTFPIGALKLHQQLVGDYLVAYTDWFSKVRPEQADQTLKKVVTLSDEYTPDAFMPAVEIIVEYDVAEQVVVTTAAATTIQPTTASDTTTATAPTATQSSTIISTKPSVVVDTATAKAPTTTPAPVVTTSPRGPTKDKGTNPLGLSDELYYIIIVVPIAVIFILLIIIISVVVFYVRRRKNHDAESLEDFKRANQSGGGGHSDSGSDMVHDYEITDSYRYPQPMSNTAYQPDSMGSETYAQMHRPYKVSDGHSDLNETTAMPPADDSPKPSVIMGDGDHDKSQHQEGTTQLFDNELYTPC